MLKKYFSILFLVPYIIQLRADEAPFELGLFQEIMYEYLTNNPFAASPTCPEMIDSESSGITLFGSSVPCEGSLMDCEKLRVVSLCAERTGQRKIHFVHGARQDYYYTIFGHSYNCTAAHRSQYYPRRVVHESDDPSLYYSQCNCRCFKDYFRIHVGEVRSWESDNYVIVGIRLKLQDDVLHLQIAEGILEANGVISEFTWLPPPYNPSHYHNVDLNSRNFFLDHLTLDPSYAMTGVKFEYMEVNEPDVIKGFGISISGVPFDSSTGKLDLKPENRKIVKANPHTLRKELKYKLVNPENQIASPSNRPSPLEYNYVKLERSEIVSDFGQTTLPLFDSRSVMISPLMPLAGIGILHNGTEDHAGFIALQLYPIY